MKKNIILFTICLCLVCFSGCGFSGNQFPDSLIVYQIGDFEKHQVGFVNPDGSNNIIYNGEIYLINPTWSLDGKSVYGLARRSQLIVAGYPAYWTPNGNFECEWFIYWQIQEIDGSLNSNLALITGSKEIRLADITNCKIQKTLVDYSQRGGLSIDGAYLSPDKKWLVYGLETDLDLTKPPIYQILKLDIDKFTSTVLDTGINPIFSPDGSRISYVKPDGIYIMNADGTQSKMVVAHSFVNSEYHFGPAVTIPRWSPDGKWLIYHRCEKFGCVVSDNTIYKLNLSSGKEEKIIDGGVYPDWRTSNP
jgi:Tol biopolymer transport system component